MIRAYQGDVNLLLIPEIFRAELGTLVDMEFIGKGKKKTNSEGWERNRSKFFRKLKKDHPEYFSEENKKKITAGRSPVVDEQFLKYFPQYSEYENQVLIHHHIGGSGQAFAIPLGLHIGFGGVHNYEEEAGVRGNDHLTAVGQTFVDNM